MEYIVLIPAVAFVILCCISRAVYCVWWKPKSLERYFRRMGIRGNCYKLVYGDMEDTKKYMAEARSKPMPLNHKIVPRVQPVWHQMVQKYGEISLSWHERRAKLLVADARLMKDILNDKNGHFRRNPPTNPLVNLLTQGVSELQGSQWEKRRKLIAPAFHHDKILGMTPEFLASCSSKVEQWKERMSAGDGKFELDIAPEMQHLASDIIARAAFGTSFEEAETIFELQKEQAVLVVDAFQSLYFPGLRLLPTKKNRRRYEIDGKIKAMLKDMIRSKERKIEKGEADDDLLSLLLKCQKQSDNDMTLDDVMEECKLFYFAGQETTANWLTWTLIVLAMHPDWQQKAREEVLRVFGKRTPNVKTLNQLKIVWMILQEVLRLYPPLIGLSRYTLQSTRVGDMAIPAGVELVLPTVMLHRDPEHWGEDAEEFKPERFAAGASKATKDETAFYPFGWGPRFCLGQNFASVEAKLTLTMILQHFSFELSPSYTHAPHVVITLQPQHGAPLVLHQI